jgi:hypothetical protein
MGFLHSLISSSQPRVSQQRIRVQENKITIYEADHPTLLLKITTFYLSLTTKASSIILTSLSIL